MPVEYLLKVDGIPGESPDGKHKDEIEVESFGFGVTQTLIHELGSGVGAGKASFGEFHFVARKSKATPKLFVACASGKHIANAVLTCRRAGSAQQEFLVITLSDVLVSSYEIEGDGDDPDPVDLVSLAYGQVQLEYRARNPDGTLEPPVKAGWDVKQNAEI